MTHKKKKTNLFKKIILAGALTFVGGLTYNFIQQPANNALNFKEKEFNSKHGRITYSSEGDISDIVFVPQTHPLQKTLYEYKHQDVENDISKLCEELHDSGITSIMVEGLLPYDAEEYRRGNLKAFVSTDGKTLYPFLQSRKWDLLPSEDTDLRKVQWELEKPFRDIQIEFRESVRERLESFYQSIYVPEGEGFRAKKGKIVDEMERELTRSLADLTEFYNQRVDSTFASLSDEVMYLKVHARERLLLKRASEHIEEKGTPLIIVYGASHHNGIVKNFEKGGKAISVVSVNSLPPIEGIQITEEVVRRSFYVSDEIVAEGSLMFDHNGRAKIFFRGE